ncbi:MAG TPA: bacillithiol biosynthesis BshC, partial [Gemmatimonadales bacterium]
FWVAGDDHDFAEANHTAIIDAAGNAATIVLRQRAPGEPQRPMFREPCGPEITGVLETLRTATPETEFKAAMVAWLAAAYRPEVSLADAFAGALNTLLGPRGLAVFRAHDVAAKRASAPWLVRALGVTLPDGLSPVLVEGALGRDRLRLEAGAAVTRRSGEHFGVPEVERVAAADPQRLSPNVLLRPAVEAALFPTVAYCAGPGELAYLPDAAPCYAALGVEAQTPVPRWSGLLLEPRIEKTLERHGLEPGAFDSPPGVIESRLVRDGLPQDTVALLSGLRDHLAREYDRLAQAAAATDPTLERTVQSARNAALAGTHDIEKKLVASAKRSQETLTGQIARARAALRPGGAAQERVLTVASFLIRYGPELIDAVADEVARWTDAR